ncbi:MAG: LamG-like jellyroll fold domain-containing protein [Planctomycetota bacterium]
MDIQQVTELVLKHLDGSISDSEFRELQKAIESDREARFKYVELARLDAELREMGGFPPEAQLTKDAINMPLPVNSFHTQWRIMRGLAIAVALAFVAISSWAILWDEREADAPEQLVGSSLNPPVRSVAVISAEAEAIWEATTKLQLQKGSALEPGTLVLLNGLAQIDFFSGASITLSGPAELELRSSELAILRRGRVRADVPPAARGFEIRTADVRLEDLGTSFGIEANRDGRSEVVVFDGEVRAIDKHGDELSLFAGDSAALSKGKASMSSSHDLEALPDLSAIVKRADGLDQSRYVQWKDTAAERSKDSRLVAYYDFEGLNGASRRLSNRAVSGQGSELDGGIVGASVANGRWPGKKALDFRGEGDRVRFSIPGEFDAMTLYAWVRIDALDRHLNSLFLTDYYDAGEIHWQISSAGSLHVATSPSGVPIDPIDSSKVLWDQLGAQNHTFWSDHFWDASKSGQWYFLATTIDRLEREPVSHYINGKRVGFSGGSNMEQRLPKLRIGTADLGNWTEPITPESSIRSLNGRIDEFAIFSVALTDTEIAEIYEQGKP